MSRAFFDNKHIVIVDDEDISLNVSSYLLESLGADVTGFSDPQEAYVFCCRWHRDIDILLLDVIMPTLNGLELAERIHKINPALPIIGLSANNTDADKDECLANGMTALLNKPLRATDLSALFE